MFGCIPRTPKKSGGSASAMRRKPRILPRTAAAEGNEEAVRMMLAGRGYGSKRATGVGGV
jgi:hypothetical protein